MGGRIVDLLNSPHRATEALLPWLLNGTLSQAERAEVDAHLQACPQCREELARQRELMAAYRASPLPEAQLDGEAALARLRTRLRADAARPTLPQRLVARGRALAARWWPATVALQMGVILALGASLWMQLNASPQGDAAALYRGLGAAEQRATGDALVIFDPRAGEAELRGALLRAGARVVDGPTATGAYIVRFDGGHTPSKLAALRGEAAVRRVDSLAAESQ